MTHCREILSVEEMARIIDAAASLLHRAMLMVLYSTGMTTPSVHIKVVIVGLLDAPGNYPDYDVVRNAQRAFVTADSNAVFIDTRGIRLNPASPFHLDADGYCEVGERIAEALRDPYQTPN